MMRTTKYKAQGIASQVEMQNQTREPLRTNLTVSLAPQSFPIKFYNQEDIMLNIINPVTNMNGGG